MAQRLKPDDVAAWVRIGVTLTELGRPAEAMPYLDAAMRAAPGWPEPRRRLALAFLRQGRREDARAAYLQLVPLMPATAEGYRDLADMLAEGQQYPEAVRFYREARAALARGNRPIGSGWTEIALARIGARA